MRVDEEDIGRYKRRRQGRSPAGAGKRSNRILIFAILLLGGIIVFLFRAELLGDLSGGAGTNQSAVAAAPALEPPAPVAAGAAENGGAAAEAVGLANNRLEVLDRQVQELKRQVEFLVGANNRDNAQFRKVDSQVNGLSSSLNSLQRSINSLSGSIQAISGQIERLDSRVQAELAQQAETNGLNSENLENIRTDLINLNSLYSNQVETINDIRRNLAGINNRVTELER